MKRRTVVPIVLSAVLLGAIDASAQEGGDLTNVELGVRFFMGEIQGRLRKGNPPAVGSTNVQLDGDLDSSDDATGGGFVLTGTVKGGHTFGVSGWQFSSDGSATMSSTNTFGSLTLGAGTPASTDVDVRSVMAKFVYGLTPDTQAYRVGLGAAARTLSFETEISQGGGVKDRLEMRTIYATAEVEFSYRVGESLLLKAEGGVGMPSYAKKGLDIQYPIEVRAGIRVNLGALAVEGGYQVFDAKMVRNENQVEEDRANINLNGLYFELAARF
jgi:hypothetical protein